MPDYTIGNFMQRMSVLLQGIQINDINNNKEIKMCADNNLPSELKRTTISKIRNIFRLIGKYVTFHISESIINHCNSVRQNSIQNQAHRISRMDDFKAAQELLHIGSMRKAVHILEKIGIQKTIAIASAVLSKIQERETGYSSQSAATFLCALKDDVGCAILSRMTPAKAADVLQDIVSKSDDGIRTATSLLENMDSKSAASILQFSLEGPAARLLSSMVSNEKSQTAANILQECKLNEAGTLLTALEPDIARQILEKYGDDTPSRFFNVMDGMAAKKILNCYMNSDPAMTKIGSKTITEIVKEMEVNEKDLEDKKKVIDGMLSSNKVKEAAALLTTYPPNTAARILQICDGYKAASMLNILDDTAIKNIFAACRIQTPVYLLGKMSLERAQAILKLYQQGEFGTLGRNSFSTDRGMVLREQISRLLQNTDELGKEVGPGQKAERVQMAADLLISLPDNQAVIILQTVPGAAAMIAGVGSATIERFVTFCSSNDPSLAAKILTEFTKAAEGKGVHDEVTKAAEMLSRLPADHAARILQSCDTDIMAAMIRHMPTGDSLKKIFTACIDSDSLDFAAEILMAFTKDAEGKFVDDNIDKAVDMLRPLSIGSEQYNPLIYRDIPVVSVLPHCATDVAATLLSRLSAETAASILINCSIPHAAAILEHISPDGTLKEILNACGKINGKMPVTWLGRMSLDGALHILELYQNDSPENSGILFKSGSTVVDTFDKAKNMVLDRQIGRFPEGKHGVDKVRSAKADLSPLFTRMLGRLNEQLKDPENATVNSSTVAELFFAFREKDAKAADQVLKSSTEQVVAALKQYDRPEKEARPINGKKA